MAQCDLSGAAFGARSLNQHGIVVCTARRHGAMAERRRRGTRAHISNDSGQSECLSLRGSNERHCHCADVEFDCQDLYLAIWILAVMWGMAWTAKALEPRFGILSPCEVAHVTYHAGGGDLSSPSMYCFTEDASLASTSLPSPGDDESAAPQGENDSSGEERRSLRLGK